MKYKYGTKRRFNNINSWYNYVQDYVKNNRYEGND